MADMQTTYIMINPDGVQRGLIGEIITRFERKGLRMVGLRQLTPSMELAEAHYAVHSERPFYSGLIEFITSGPCLLYTSPSPRDQRGSRMPSSA